MKSYADWFIEKTVAKLNGKEMHIFIRGGLGIDGVEHIFYLSDFSPQIQKRILDELVKGSCENCRKYAEKRMSNEIIQ